jgi:hypothetical protein
MKLISVVWVTGLLLCVRASGVNSSPDNASRVLGIALKQMQIGIWEVDATISRAFTMRVHGLIAGEDFDLTLEPEDRNAVRQIAIKDKIWVSYDGSKTWKLEAASNHPTFRRDYGYVHTPIHYETTLPAFEIVAKETHDGEAFLHLRRKLSGKSAVKVHSTDYWLALGQDTQPPSVRRYEGPVTEQGHENEPLYCQVTYRPADSKAAIQPPPSDNVSDEKGTKSSSSSGPTETVTLLGGKLRIDIPADFPPNKGSTNKQSLAKFSNKNGAWGEVLRGTHGLTPEGLPAYLQKRVDEYSKGLNWGPAVHTQWLRKEIVDIGGRSWADWRFVPMAKGAKDYKSNPVYTRFLTTSYKGQLLEITFTTNLNTEPELKEKIDRIMESIRLEE